MMEDEWRWIFADRLESLIERRGLTHREFADRVGVSEVCVSWYMNANRTPSIRTLLRMCDVLDCTMDMLVV